MNFHRLSNLIRPCKEETILNTLFTKSEGLAQGMFKHSQIPHGSDYKGCYFVYLQAAYKECSGIVHEQVLSVLTCIMN